MQGVLTGLKGELIGYVGGTPELRYTPSGKAVLTISVAAYGTDKMPTMWVNCTLWEKLAEAVNAVDLKGCVVKVTGLFMQRVFTYKDGAKKGQSGNENKMNVQKFEYARKQDSEFTLVQDEKESEAEAVEDVKESAGKLKAKLDKGKREPEESPDKILY